MKNPFTFKNRRQTEALWPLSVPTLEATLGALQSVRSEIFFVNIGANEGRWCDPLFPYIQKNGWKGVLVEPQTLPFHKLVENYMGVSGVRFENSAISTSCSAKEFYRLGFCEDEWATVLSSFSRQHLVKHKQYILQRCAEHNIVPPADFEDWIVEDVIQCITFSQLIEKHELPRVDVLHMDTEGYDFEIIRSIDFTALQPSLIHYEHVHLSSHDKKACKQYLEDNGYCVYTQPEMDTVAIAKKTRNEFVVNQIR